MSSLIYKNKYIYDFAMFLSYGRYSPDRLTKIAEFVSDESSVLDVCCGPCNLYPLLKKKNVTYTGLDLSEHFIQYARRRGIDARLFDLLQDDLPEKEYDHVLMQSSLYQFIPNHTFVIRRMLYATKQYVIIAEPIVNLVDRVPSFISKVIETVKDPNRASSLQL